MDFMVLYSSGLCVLSEPGQGDYTAANSYESAYAEEMGKKGRKVLAIDWVSWKSAGMSVDYGFNKDAIFKAITTEKAINGLDVAMNKKINRLLVGEFCYSPQFLYLLDKLPIKLSEKVMAKISKIKRPEIMNKSANKPLNKGEVSLKGKEDGTNYSETELKVAGVFHEVLGFSEININDTFFELGGDSVMLNKMFDILDREYPDILKLVDLFTYTSIATLSKYIILRQGDKDENTDDTYKEFEVDDSKINNFDDLVDVGDIEDMLNGIESGNLSIEEMLEKL